MGFTQYKTKNGRQRVLINSRMLKETPEEDIDREINRLVNLCGRKRLGSNLDEMFSHQKVREKIPSFFRKLEDITRAATFETSNNERCLELYRALFVAQSVEINKFVAARDAFEKAITLNDLVLAKSIIDEMHSVLGESMWWVKAKLILLFLAGNSDDMQGFCDEIQDRTGNTASGYNFSSLIWTTQSSAPYYNLQKFISKAVDEFRTAKQHSNAWLLEALFFPKMLDEGGGHVQIDMLQLFPVVDQYVVTVAYIYYTLGVQSPEPSYARFLRSVLEELRRTIHDPQLESFSASLVLKDKKLSSLAGKKILELYEAGRYEECIGEYVSGLRGLDSPIMYLNIIAKAQLYISDESKIGYPLLDKTLKGLREIYSLSSRASRARDEIIDSIVRFHGTGIAIELQSLLAVATPQVYDDNRLIGMVALSICRGKGGLPLHLSLLEQGKKIFSSAYRFSTADVLESRVIRCVGVDEDIDIDFFECDHASDVLVKDIIEFKARILWHRRELEKLIGIAASYLVDNQESYLSLPMEGMVNHIESKFLCALDSIIVCHFYTKFISEDRRATLNELFEEFIFSNGCDKPSDMFEVLGDLSDPKNLIFFQHICTFENLDFLSVFQNSDELRAERIKIIEVLYNNKLIPRDEYFEELELIVRQVVMDYATSSFSRSKIYVDHSAVKRKALPEVSSLFELFRASKDSGEDSEGEDALIILNDAPNTDSIGSAMLPGRRNSLLVKILDLVRNYFLFDETFGLDSNLSSEIRHGIFSNFIRSEVDAKKLLTEKTSSGTYEQNKYWRTIYSGILTPGFLNVIDGELAKFCEGFNLLVAEAEKWMKISMAYEEGEAAFRYVTPLADFSVLREQALLISDADELVDVILDWLWSSTEDGLEVMKERINDGFKTRVDTLFDDLAERINAVKGEAELKELMGNIFAAKNNTREIIREVSEWFFRSERKTFDSQELDQLIAISISCFEKIKGRSFEVVEQIDESVRGYYVSGEYVNSTILAMINLLTNCTRHSGLGEGVVITIAVRKSGEGFAMEIYNALSEQRDLEITQEFIDDKNALLSSKDALELLRLEGGTGLVKAFHHLKSASNCFDLRVRKGDKVFTSEVIYEPVDIVG